MFGLKSEDSDAWWVGFFFWHPGRVTISAMNDCVCRLVNTTQAWKRLWQIRSFSLVRNDIPTVSVRPTRQGPLTEASEVRQARDSVVDIVASRMNQS
jgi:hypothetical protein